MQEHAKYKQKLKKKKDAVFVENSEKESKIRTEKNQIILHKQAIFFNMCDVSVQYVTSPKE